MPLRIHTFMKIPELRSTANGPRNHLVSNFLVENLNPLVEQSSPETTPSEDVDASSKAIWI